MAHALSQTVIRPPRFPVWKTVKLGPFGSGAEYVRAINNRPMRLCSFAEAALLSEAFACSNRAIELDLVNISVAELGFARGAPYSAICERAEKLGLELCPAEVAPALRLALTDQKPGDWIAIAMKPIPGADGTPEILHLDHDELGLWMFAFSGHPDTYWFSFRRFIFHLRPE